MKFSTRLKLIALILVILLQGIFILPPKEYAATTPSLGQAASFGILSSTYTNTAIGTTINGDLGYTTPPAVPATVTGTVHSADSTYNTAGTDQNSALSTLNAQPCDFNFGSATDLNQLSQPLTPGVYCITGAGSVGTGGAGGAGITLSGSGTYIFRMDGALNTTANSIVTLSNGASACDVFWTPTAAATMGANSTFAGTIIAAAGITIGSTVTWTGRALAFGGTVSTTTDTITVPTCVAATTTPTSPTSTTSTSTTSNSNSTSTSTGGSAPNLEPAITTVPEILSSKRVSPTSILITWGPYAGINTFNIRYGLTNGNWLYNTNVTGFSTTINDLPPNQPIWIQVAAKNNSSIGTYGIANVTGGPGMPNTGRSLYETVSPWYLLLSIILGSLSCVFMIKSTKLLYKNTH